MSETRRWAPSVGTIGLLVFGLLTLMRLLMHASADAPTLNFAFYYDVANALRLGVDPYTLENLPHVQSVPVVLPFQAVLLVPWTYLPHWWASQIFFWCNLVAVTVLWHYLWKLYSGVPSASFSRKYWLGFLVFVNLAPVIAGLGLRQLSISVSLLILVALYSESVTISGLSLAVASVLKLSMTPLFGVLMLFTRRFRECALATVIFGAFAVAPVLFGHSLSQLYSDYAKVHSDLMSGYNQFGGSNGFTMVNAGIFKWGPANQLVKVFALVLFALVLRRQRAGKYIDAIAVLAVISATMLLVYHRAHDFPIGLGIILAWLLSPDNSQSRFHRVFCAGVVLFFFIPWTIQAVGAEFLGTLMKENAFIWLTSDWRHVPNLVPLAAIVMLLISVYSFYLVMTKKPAQESLS